MTTEVKQSTESTVTTSDKLATLKKQRADINYQISQLTPKKQKNNPEQLAKGKIFYLHNSYRWLENDDGTRRNLPRLTIAGHVDESRNELHWAVYVCMPNRQFARKTGRMRAMGKAVSTKRQITKLRQLTPDYIREKMYIELQRIESKVYENYIHDNLLKVDKIINLADVFLVKSIKEQSALTNGKNKGGA